MRKQYITLLTGLLLVMISFASPSAGQHDDIDFEPHVEYTVNIGPSSIVAADLNGDGHLDLATACNGDFATDAQNVSVLINHGNGTFEPHKEYPTDNGPYDIAAGDMNGDGDIDLVTANAVLLGDNTVSVLLNNGDGTFGTHVEYESDMVPEAVALTDIDKDGDTDIICANNMGFSLSVLLNNGDGTFAPRIDYDNEYLSMDVEVADFDKDGWKDVATVNNNWAGETYSLSVFLNYGNGTLSPVNYYTTGDSPDRLATGDFDEDGDIDIAVSKIDDTTLDIFLSNGDGTFAERSPFALGHDADDLFAGDVDGDGHIDLVTIYVQGYTSQKVDIVFGWGNASFGDSKTYDSVSGASAVLAADLEGDTKNDIVISNGGGMLDAGTTVSVLIQAEAVEPNGDGPPPQNGNATGEKESLLFEDPLFLLIIIIVIIAVIVSAVMVTRKKKKKKGAVQAAAPVAVPAAPVQPAAPAQTVTWAEPAAPAASQPPRAAAPPPSPRAAAPPPVQAGETIRCPKCNTLFTITTAQRPVQVECPKCHTKGTFG